MVILISSFVEGVGGRWVLRPAKFDTRYTINNIKEKVTGQFNAPMEYFLAARQFRKLVIN